MLKQVFLLYCEKRPKTFLIIDNLKGIYYEKTVCIGCRSPYPVSTWSGAKDDTNRNWDKTKETAERVADKTGEAVKKGGNAVGRGMSHVGEKIEAATE